MESNVKMTRCRLQGVDDEVGMARWSLKMLGAERGCLGGRGWRGGQGCWGSSRLIQGEAVKLEEAVDGEVKMVRWI